MAASSIELEGVTKKYRSEAAAVAGLDLAVASGERIAVLGPSGSGKTTLLRLIAGLEPLDSGQIRLNGRDVSRVPPYQRGVGMVFQSPALYPYLNVRDNLASGLKARGVSRRRRHERAAELADTLALTPLLHRRPAELSGGEQQRVALGRALAPGPAVLLLDEPFSSLDEPLRAELRAELVEIHQRCEATILHVTHDQAEALALGQRVAVLRAGRLVQVGTPGEVHDRPADRFVASFVGSPGMNFLDSEARREAGLMLPPPVRRLVLGVRPEHVSIVAADTSLAASQRGPGLPARIESIEFQGHSALVSLRLGPGRIAARVPPHARYAPDDIVQAWIDLIRCCWFDPATGQRVDPDCQAGRESIA